MILAKKLRETNIAEYLLYMWQVEDILRASKLNIDKIENKIISKYDEPEDVLLQIREWYEGLIEMMRLEDCTESGHLIVNKNVITELNAVNISLTNSSKELEYNAIYYKTLPFIVELRAKSNNKNETEIETCFNALYGFLLMRLQKKEISGETQAAISQISSLLRHLSHNFHLQEKGELDI